MSREQAEAWKQRLRFTDKGAVRKGVHPILFTVRAFYVDIAQWAAARQLLGAVGGAVADLLTRASGLQQAAQTTVAEYHQRTRELAPLLPKLVAKAESERREAAETHAAALEARHGGTIEFRGREWRVIRLTATSPVRLRIDPAHSPDGSAESPMPAVAGLLTDDPTLGAGRPPCS